MLITVVGTSSLEKIREKEIITTGKRMDHNQPPEKGRNRIWVSKWSYSHVRKNGQVDMHINCVCK